MVHAAFAVVILPSGKIAGVTRQPEGIGLPGGKLKPGETSVQAAIRESAEEGWNVSGTFFDVHKDVVDNKNICWILFSHAMRRDEWKEMERISPIEISIPELSSSGMGNYIVAKKLSHAINLMPLMKAAGGDKIPFSQLIAAGMRTYVERVPAAFDYKDAAAQSYYELANAMLHAGINIYKKIPHGGDCPRAFLDWVKDARTKFKQ
jgi:ADP-ribose pyrophosphatase YjhB (NUDIX family)